MIGPKTILLAISLSLTACGTLVPEPPEVWQCGHSVRFNKFRCVNTVTHEAINVRRDDARMEAAQCLSADDYKKMENWIATVKEIAERRCR